MLRNLQCAIPFVLSLLPSTLSLTISSPFPVLPCLFSSLSLSDFVLSLSFCVSVSAFLSLRSFSSFFLVCDCPYLPLRLSLSLPLALSASVSLRVSVSLSLSLSPSVSLHRLAHIYEYAFKGASDVRSMSSVGPIVDHWSPRQCFGFEQSWLRVAIGSPNCNLVSDKQQLTAEPTKIILSHSQHFTCHVDK